MTLYPMGYGKDMVTLTQMKARHLNRMEPEFARRLFNWLESRGGAVGIGGGRRTVQPDKPGFAPAGMSFHQDQKFYDNTTWYSAVDLVHVNPGNVHRAPTVAECPQQGTIEALRWGIHINTYESWHMQAVPQDGYKTWLTIGRRRPDPDYVIPGDRPDNDPLPPPPLDEEDDLKFASYRQLTGTVGIFAHYHSPGGIGVKVPMRDLDMWASHARALMTEGVPIPDVADFGMLYTDDVNGFRALGTLSIAVDGLDVYGVPV